MNLALQKARCIKKTTQIRDPYNAGSFALFMYVYCIYFPWRPKLCGVFGGWRKVPIEAYSSSCLSFFSSSSSSCVFMQQYPKNHFEFEIFFSFFLPLLSDTKLCSSLVWHSFICIWRSERNGLITFLSFLVPFAPSLFSPLLSMKFTSWIIFRFPFKIYKHLFLVDNLSLSWSTSLRLVLFTPS